MTFGPNEFKRAIVAALGSLRAHQASIDEANVFPVPDGDTGTNMLLTMSAAAEALGSPDPFAAAPRAALVGARGNSGVVLAQWLRGFCETAGPGDPAAVVRGLRRAAELAYTAVLEPVEGTILTAARAAADAAGGPTAAEIFESAAAGARAAVDRTPDLLPVLKQAGVVDAGALGLWIVLDAFGASLSGREPAAAPGLASSAAPRAMARESGSSRFGYEVQYLLEAADEVIEPLRAELGRIGDSVVVSGGGGLWNVHVHTNDTGEAVEIGRAVGTVRTASVTAFADRTGGPRSIPVARAAAPVSVVAVVAGEGFARLFAELGAGVVIDGGSTVNPSVGEIADAIRRCPAADVIVLPNNDDAIPAAMQACELVTDRRAVVVGTHDLAHGVTTMLAYGDARDLETNAAQMRQAASVAASAKVIVAARDATTPAGTVRAGQAIAFCGADVAAIEQDPVSAVVRVVTTMDDEEPIEVVTVFAGATAPAGERSALEKALRDTLPGVDVDVRDGGQPVERYLIAVE
ncbi:MAG TPA: DAK2 domain-containing protein [Actinomycetota bacterium]|nr:DAK2 domain-containing protein [Actinomycetota bacterium]